MNNYDTHTRYGVTEADELRWHWLVLCYGAGGALGWLEKWGEM